MEMFVKNKQRLTFVFIIVIVVIAWISGGIWLFSTTYADLQSWQRGEIGDFFGGGLGGIAAFCIIYTIWVQSHQLKVQDTQDARATTLRIFELLKFEVENLSARIVSKLRSNDEYDKEFDSMLGKFHSGDRTVFLRAMQRMDFQKEYENRSDNEELVKAKERFVVILKLIKEELRNVSNNQDENFADAIKQTEIYQTFEICFPEESSLKKK